MELKPLEDPSTSTWKRVMPFNVLMRATSAPTGTAHGGLQGHRLPSWAPRRPGCGHPARREGESTYPRRGVPARGGAGHTPLALVSAETSWTPPSPSSVRGAAVSSPGQSAGSYGSEGGTRAPGAEGAPRGVDCKRGPILEAPGRAAAGGWNRAGVP